MNLSRDSIRNALRRLSGRATLVAQKKTIEGLPLRAELFSADQMEQHGTVLAGIHRISTGRSPDQLLARLADNESGLLQGCKLLTAAVKANRRISPAGEWLLDNFYLIDEQIRTAKRHLPKGYSRELPRLARGPSAGLPRVYDIALEAISHGDGWVDPVSLRRFVAAYQKVTPLMLGELWAIPIMLRLALIENLRRVGVRVTASTIDRERADEWADQMMLAAEQDPKSLILIIADMARSNPPMASSFVAELARRLQGQSAALALPLTWIEQRLSELDLTIEQLVQSETQKQASAQVSISNSIGSLRLLGAINWREFVEALSFVEQKLREDPDGVYATMDFATRDQYRHAVEKLAKSSRLSELDIARKAVQLAHAAAAGGASPDRGTNETARASHVGFYLVDRGLPQLKQMAEVHPSFGASVRAFGSRFPLPVYVGAIAVLTLGFTALLVYPARASGLSGAWLMLTGAATLVSMSQFAVAVVNWLATVLATPRPLPRLDFSRGIPPDLRTLVVVPAMLTNA
ncbi:MAG TPA: cyclic beta 1-2 glucan synthetase, partial [Burkholderiales bacterium]|nr:cyclic beta 1-2 glucan synthetase [Burkholderiales bacterium]